MRLASDQGAIEHVAIFISMQGNAKAMEDVLLISMLKEKPRNVPELQVSILTTNCVVL